MSNIIVDRAVTKNAKGGFSVNTKDGKYLGTFTNKDHAMERLWSHDNQKKHRESVKKDH
jgi:hypothetical protein